MNQQEHERYVKEDPANLTDRELVEFQPQADAQSRSLENSTDDDDQFDCLFLRRRSTALSEEIAKRNGVREKQREQESVEATKKLLLTDAVTLPVGEVCAAALVEMHDELRKALSLRYDSSSVDQQLLDVVGPRCAELRAEARSRGEYILDRTDVWTFFEGWHSDQITDVSPLEIFYEAVYAESKSILWDGVDDPDSMDDNHDQLMAALIEVAGDVDTSELATKTLDETVEAGLRYGFEIREKIKEKLVPILQAAMA